MDGQVTYERCVVKANEFISFTPSQVTPSTLTGTKAARRVSPGWVLCFQSSPTAAQRCACRHCRCLHRYFRRPKFFSAFRRGQHRRRTRQPIATLLLSWRRNVQATGCLHAERGTTGGLQRLDRPYYSPQPPSGRCTGQFYVGRCSPWLSSVRRHTRQSASQRSAGSRGRGGWTALPRPQPAPAAQGSRGIVVAAASRGLVTSTKTARGCMGLHSHKYQQQAEQLSNYQ